MDLEKVELLIEAVKLKSFTKCADKFSYTPSALSHIADAVERQLGLKILERDFKGINLTPEGKEIFPYLEELVNKSHEIQELSKTLSKKQSRLTIGCYSSISKNLLPELLIKFKQACPTVKVNIVVGDSLEEMINKNADLFFISHRELNNLEFAPVYSDRYVAVVKEGTFNGKKALSLDDFKDYPFIMPSDGAVKSTFSNLDYDTISVSATDDSSIIAMVKNGLGVSVLPELSVKKAGKGVKIIKLCPEIKRELGVAYKKEIKNPSIKKFLNFINKL